MKTAVVIGAGIGGIAAALRLSKKGYQVTIFEANDYPGGKLSAFSLGEYRFDAGPSLFTMPQYVTELFELHDEKPSDFFTYQKKKIACRYFWEDQTQITAYADPKLFLEEVQKKLGVKADVLEEYLKRAKAGEHDAMLIGWSGDNGDPDNWLGTLYGCDAVDGNNFSKWCFEDYDKLVKAAKRTTDVAERTKLYKQAQVILKREVPITPLAHSTVYQPMRKEVQDFRISPFALNSFYGVGIAK